MKGAKTKMRIAIPLSQGLLSPHFGHCEEFAIVEVNPQQKAILTSTRLPSPEHAPGFLPRWLRELEVNLVIVGGMGPRAAALFEQASIEVVTGAPTGTPEAIVQDYLKGVLATGPNVCDH